MCNAGLSAFLIVRHPSCILPLPCTILFYEKPTEHDNVFKCTLEPKLVQQPTWAYRLEDAGYAHAQNEYCLL